MSELMEISLLALAVPTLDIASFGARTGIIVIAHRDQRSWLGSHASAKTAAMSCASRAIESRAEYGVRHTRRSAQSGPIYRRVRADPGSRHRRGANIGSARARSGAHDSNLTKV